MLKLMKYELRKQAFSKLIILIIAGLGEIMFFTGFVLDKENTMGLAIGLLIMFTFGALFFIAFESILTYYNDLRQKQSYMLFLTPSSSYSIVGAKVISSGVQVILSGIAFALIFVIDASALLAKYSSLQELRDMIHQFVKLQFNVNVNARVVILVVLVLLISWISIITLAFFSITLSTTFLADKKGKALISFIIFIILNVIINKFNNLINDIHGIGTNISFALIAALIVYTIVTVITFLATSWMLERKVSV